MPILILQIKKNKQWIFVDHISLKRKMLKLDFVVNQPNYIISIQSIKVRVINLQIAISIDDLNVILGTG